MNETSVIQVEVYAEDADEAFGVIEGALAGAGILATVTRWAQSGVHVFVSEFNAPEGWTPIWERERSVGVGLMSGASYTKKTDKLFVYGKGYK